ncbi:hypothetical protein BIU98_06680 [Curtobacterium sp. MMLR14_010]|nr:hypothetical protein BIU98_06680 [Curtobacterium sp. MMLR14_010]
MLVTMKQSVLDRAEDRKPAPRRRGRRAGIAIGVIALLGLGATGGGVALGMIPQPFAAAPAPTTTPSPTEPAAPSTPAAAPVQETPDPAPPQTPSATATPSPAAATIPADCTGLVAPSEAARLFGETPLYDPTGKAELRNAAPLTTTLSCLWRDPRSDVSGLSIDVGTGTAEQLTAYEAGLTAKGATCTDRDEARVCTQTQQAAQYPVDTTDTWYFRGTTWFHVNQTNFPTTDLLGAVEQQIWG